MRKILLKKGLILGIIIIFVGTSVVASIGWLDNEIFLIENNQLIQTHEYEAKSSYQIGPLGDAPWWNTSWMYRNRIAINHNQVAGDLVNFPVLIKTSMNVSKVQTDGEDIIFTTYDGVKLNHEIEWFNSASGELIAWMNIASLSSLVDTTFWMYYGNPSCTNQQNQHNVWDSNYVMVQHFKEILGIDHYITSHSNDGNLYGGVNRMSLIKSMALMRLMEQAVT